VSIGLPAPGRPLSHKYTGGPHPGFAGPNPEWVTATITADKVTTTWPSE
jgi:hypothetical protein